MTNFKIRVFSVLADDETSITGVQAKINQWITTGLLKKYDVHTTATHVIFNVLLNKEA